MGEMGVCVLMMVAAQIKTITRNNLSWMLQRPHIMRLIIAQQKSPESWYLCVTSSTSTGTQRASGAGTHPVSMWEEPPPTTHYLEVLTKTTTTTHWHTENKIQGAEWMWGSSGGAIHHGKQKKVESAEMERSHWEMALLQGWRWRWGWRWRGKIKPVLAVIKLQNNLNIPPWHNKNHTHSTIIPHLLHLHNPQPLLSCWEQSGSVPPLPRSSSLTLSVPCGSPSIHLPSWVSSSSVPAHWGDRWGPACNGSGCPHSFSP